MRRLGTRTPEAPRSERSSNPTSSIVARLSFGRSTESYVLSDWMGRPASSAEAAFPSQVSRNGRRNGPEQGGTMPAPRAYAKRPGRSTGRRTIAAASMKGCEVEPLSRSCPGQTGYSGPWGVGSGRPAIPRQYHAGGPLLRTGHESAIETGRLPAKPLEAAASVHTGLGDGSLTASETGVDPCSAPPLPHCCWRDTQS